MDWAWQIAGRASKMTSIKWCLNTKNGLELVEPNTNLSQAYLKKAEDSLKSIDMNKIKEWKNNNCLLFYLFFFICYFNEIRN